ncbi:hypothetical protein MAPG_02200 [Magnaporthiopsis poae ATCC 64411]|uniref:Uncharacterized protein n=1 Tax=Magnaporthiopsis poae (strain ATCC 64411 / 73-15) TaxID=644358 RepID=A0A0C4DQQ4_MAGP6|nr:hypothetical protein MAPG_02200 [Magnaporthiopsis poae ATCC 64411]
MKHNDVIYALTIRPPLPAKDGVLSSHTDGSWYYTLAGTQQSPAGLYTTFSGSASASGRTVSPCFRSAATRILASSSALASSSG